MTFTDILLQAHFPKTGGTWVTRMVCSQGARQKGGDHMPIWLSAHDKYRAGRVAFGTARNPFDYYPSLYAHCLDNTGHGPAVAAYGNGKVDFRSVLYGWTHPAEVKELPPNLGVIWGTYGGGHEALIESGKGLCSWGHRYCYGTEDAWRDNFTEWDVHALIPTDRMEEGLTALNVKLDLALLQPWNTRFHRTVSPRAKAWMKDDYAEMYDEEMLGWVREADKELLDLFGWDSPGAPAGKYLLPCSEEDLPEGFEFLDLSPPDDLTLAPHVDEGAEGVSALAESLGEPDCF